MTARDRFDVDHERYHQQQERLEALQTSVDARAQEIVEQIIGYRQGYTFGDFLWEQVTEIDPAKSRAQIKSLVEMFEQYGYMLFDRVEPGITDDRHITARDWLIEQIKTWAEQRARMELEEV